MDRRPTRPWASWNRTPFCDDASGFVCITFSMYYEVLAASDPSQLLYNLQQTSGLTLVRSSPICHVIGVRPNVFARKKF